MKIKVLWLLIAASLLGCSLDKGDSTKDGVKPKYEKPTEDANAPLDLRATQNIAYNVILQTYMDLAKASLVLSEASNRLAESPTQSNLELAQQAWRNTREPWEASEGFLFGPVEALGIDPMIDTWPLNRVDMDSILSSSRTIDADFIRGLGTNVQGFHTAEYLLFGNGENGNTKTIGQMTLKEMEYLKSVTQVLAEHTGRLSYAWSDNENPDRPEMPGYVIRMMNPGFDNELYPSVSSVVAEYVNGMAGIVDEVANGKIADPMGGDISQADVTKVESPFSWNSIADFANNIKSVKAVYTGDYKNSKGSGIDELISAKDPALARRVAQQIDLSIQKINAISNGGQMAFREAILNPQGRVRVNSAVNELHKLFDLLEQEVLPLLNK